MGNHRYFDLKNKLSKTLTSMRYQLMRDEYTDKELSVYLSKVHTGIMKLFRADAKNIVQLLTDLKNVRVVVKKQFVTNINISLGSFVKVPEYRELAPDVISKQIHGYLTDYVAAIKSNDTELRAETYVDIILSTYMNLSKLVFDADNNEDSPVVGKLEIY